MKFVSLVVVCAMVACGGNSDVPTDSDSSVADAALADVVSHTLDAAAVSDSGTTKDTGVQGDASDDASGDTDASYDGGTCHHKHKHHHDDDDDEHRCDHNGCH